MSSPATDSDSSGTSSPALDTDLSAAETTELLAREKAYSQELQRDGRWKEIWRIVGEYANYSVFDVTEETLAAIRRGDFDAVVQQYKDEFVR